MTQTSNPQPTDSTMRMTTTMAPSTPRGYTRVNNTIFDQLLPALSGNGLKILLVALRQTWGWKDDGSPTGRKLSDQISYSQFMEKGGMSRATVARAVKECLDAGVLLRVKSGCGHTYAVNPHLVPPGSETEPAPGNEPLAESGTEPPCGSKDEPLAGDGALTGSEGEPSTGAAPPPGSENELPAGNEPLAGAGTEPLCGSKDEPLTADGALTGSETKPPSSSEPEHTKLNIKVVGGGNTNNNNNILALLKGFDLSVDQEVRALAAQYSLPQVEYGIHRATRQARSNPQGLLRTWMRAGHMPLPPPEEPEHERDSARYHKLNDDAQAFKHHQAARRADQT